MERTVNVLVVDDEQVVLDSIRKLLRKENCRIRTALSAQEGLDILKEEPIDIVLTDLMMPEIDGLEMMKMIREDHPRMPVIMITGYATINTALQATKLGAFDYIAKPFSRKELVGVMKRASDLVTAAADSGAPGGARAGTEEAGHRQETIRLVGENSWLMVQEDGSILLGVEGSFVQTIGRIQSIYLPNRGDEIRQGGSYLQIFCADMRSHSIPSPLSGTVVEVNQNVIDDPESALQDPYGEGWLVRLKPSRFESERKILGL
jgi:CheY-like chemotaxis protein